MARLHASRPRTQTSSAAGHGPIGLAPHWFRSEGLANEAHVHDPAGRALENTERAGVQQLGFAENIDAERPSPEARSVASQTPFW